MRIWLGRFGGLAAAACLIRNAEVSGMDITIYEAAWQIGGGFFLCGGAALKVFLCQ
jgi:oleate hydratase